MLENQAFQQRFGNLPFFLIELAQRLELQAQVVAGAAVILAEDQIIQLWYQGMCNGDWEHTYGVCISNIDNPGWSLKVELVDTPLYEKQFEGVNFQREDENDWVICSVKNGVFQGYCGPLNLEELIGIFLAWLEHY